MFGPQYCETVSLVTSFPAELWNTWSNLVIVGFGIAALWLVWRTDRRSYGLLWLAFLLTATGIGSFLWHGLREPWALTMDTLPGGMVLLTFVYLWARSFYSAIGAGTILALFFGAAFLMMGYGRGSLPFFVSLAPVVIIFASWLIYKTKKVSLRLAIEGGIVLGCALLALLFRSIDNAVCDVIPMGTHFLWHTFLSFSAFLGIHMLLRIEGRK